MSLKELRMGMSGSNPPPRSGRPPPLPISSDPNARPVKRKPTRAPAFANAPHFLPEPPTPVWEYLFIIICLAVIAGLATK